MLSVSPLSSEVHATELRLHTIASKYQQDSDNEVPLMQLPQLLLALTYNKHNNTTNNLAEDISTVLRKSEYHPTV